MKVLTTQEYKYYAEPEDIRLIKDNIPMSKGLKWLSEELGITYVALWRKMSQKHKNYFDHLEILKIEKLLEIEFNKH